MSDGLAGIFELQTLGACSLVESGSGDRPAARILGPGKPLALLAYCAAHPDVVVSRRQLVDLLWADTPTDRRRQNIRQVVYRLRQIHEALLEVPDDEHLRVGSALRCDRTELLAAVAREDLDEVLRCYQGPFLAELAFPGGDEFEDWATSERDRLERLVAHTARTVLLRLADQGKGPKVRALRDQLLRVLRPGPLAHAVGVEVSLAVDDGAMAQRLAELLAAAEDTDARDDKRTRALVARARAWQPAAEAVGGLPTLELMGRDATFARILAAWRRASRGSTEVLVLGGIAGIGKSRVLSSIATRLQSGSGLVVIVRATPASRSIPYSFAGDAAAALAVLPGAAGVHQDSARELAALDPRLASTFRVTPSTTEAGEAIRRRAMALHDLLEAVSEQQPITLLLDDLHWCDAVSRQVLESAIARAETLPLLVVGAARGVVTDWLPHARVDRELLLPLSRDDAIEAVRSSGHWPEDPGVDQFLGAMADGAAGVPHGLTERLQLVIEQGLIRWQDAAWTSGDWLEAARAVGVSSPLDHRLAACSVDERRLLLHLALMGSSIAPEIAERSVAAMASMHGEVWQELEKRGLVTQADGAWRPTHDLIAERMLAMTTADEQREARRALVDALEMIGTESALEQALRQGVAADDDERATRVFRSLMLRLRRRGDRRHAAVVLEDCFGAELGTRRQDQLIRVLPWRLRDAFAGQRAMRAGLLLAFVLLAGMALWSRRRPVLIALRSGGAAPYAYVYGADVRRIAPALQIRSLAPLGSVREAQVELVDPPSGSTILAGSTAPFDSAGIATFVGLRIRTTARRLTLRFVAPNHAPLTVTQDFPQSGEGWFVNRLTPSGGMLAGQAIRRAGDSVLVAPGAPLRGVVQLNYAANWLAASVWLTMVPTWGDPRTNWREPEQLTTPVRHESTDVGVSLTAPTKPGRYWLLFAMDAEDSGGYIASQTNWVMGEPLWNDGNDLATLPDSLLVQITTEKPVQLTKAYPADWENIKVCGSARVTVGRQVRDCGYWGSLTGIRVVVR